LKNKEFILVSNNCWGYQLYSQLNRTYNTPFVGLFLYPDCYIKLLNDFENNLLTPLTFIEKSKYSQEKLNYPIGTINDIEIHFMHYKSEEEAIGKWQRRVQRLLGDLTRGVPMVVKFCDRDKPSENTVQQYLALPFEHKIFINSQQAQPFQKQVLATKQCLSHEQYNLVDGKMLFELRYQYFDITYWLKYKEVKQTLMSMLIKLL
jgi:uncharacterized protein (DUF1919 family)